MISICLSTAVKLVRKNSEEVLGGNGVFTYILLLILTL